MRTTLTVSIYVLLLGLACTSCSKDGTEGPIGPKGDQGEQGVPGQDGQDGADGQDGNANIMYSEWVTVAQTDWSGIGTTKIAFTQSAPEITEEIVDTGVILVYHRFGNVTRQLPYSYSPNGLHLTYTFVQGSITIEGFHLSGTAINSISPLEIRYVILPPGNPITGKSAIDYSKMTYEEVMDHFGLEY